MMMVNGLEIKPRAYLAGANLAEAYLAGANLKRAYLAEADLSGANLKRAYLAEADLSEANLKRAYLAEADLSEANLKRANLECANLERANLAEASLDGARLPPFQIPDGDLIGWKKLRYGYIAKLRIPFRARRTAVLTSRKCRAEFAEVVSIYGPNMGTSQHDPRTVYRVGETVHPNRYNDDIRIPCAPGIHFFLTREEAEAY